MKSTVALTILPVPVNAQRTSLVTIAYGTPNRPFCRSTLFPSPVQQLDTHQCQCCTIRTLLLPATPARTPLQISLPAMVLPPHRDVLSPPVRVPPLSSICNAHARHM